LLYNKFIEYEHYSITKSGKDKIKKIVKKDVDDPDVIKSLYGNRFQKKKIIEGFHYDSSVTKYLKSSFTIDFRIGKFVSVKNKQLSNLQFMTDIKPFILDTLLTLELPNFAYMSWENVIEIRESTSGRDFREYIESIAIEVTNNINNISDKRDIESIIQKYHIKALSQELCNMKPSFGKITLKILLNTTQLGGIVASIAELINYIEDNNSWISLIKSNR
jgi:hypothetical protein